MSVVAALAVAAGCVEAQTVSRFPERRITDVFDADCTPDAGATYICLDGNAEDLVVVPESDWVLASSMRGHGTLSVVNRRDRSVVKIYPGTTPRERFDRKAYPTCPGPLTGAERAQFQTHGLAIRPVRSGKHTVYAIHHGDRESVEVFELDVTGRIPAATWIGCAVQAPPVWLNSVVPLPDGGFVASDFGTPAAALAGKVDGELLRWHSRTGWRRVPDSAMSGANGIALSRDGRTIYASAWGGRSLVALPLEGGLPGRRTMPVGFLIDNLHWAPDGTLIAAGQSPEGYRPAYTRVIRIDPATMRVAPLLDYASSSKWGRGTVAVAVGDTLWLGSSRVPKIAIVPLSK